MRALYSVVTTTVVPLVAGAAKTVLGVLAPAQFGADWLGVKVSFDGILASDHPVIVEFCAVTFATNPPGTNSTSETVQQVSGRAITAGFTAARNWTAEPTVIAVLDSIEVSPNGGFYAYDWPWGESFDNDVSKGFGIRCTAPTSNVNCDAMMRFART